MIDINMEGIGRKSPVIIPPTQEQQQQKQQQQKQQKTATTTTADTIQDKSQCRRKWSIDEKLS